MANQNANLSDVICRNILKSSTSTVVLGAKNKPLTLEEIRKSLKIYNKKSEEVDEYLDSLQEVVGSVVRVTAASKAVNEIDSHLKVLYSLAEDVSNIENIVKSIQSLGDEKDNASYLKEAKTLLAKYQKSYLEAEKLLQKLSKTKRPSVLSTQKNDKLDEIINWMDSKIEKYNDSIEDGGQEIGFDIDESVYMIEPSATNPKAVRCVRFVPVENIPLVNGKTTSLYAMFEVDLYSPIVKDRLLTSQRVSPIYFRFVNKVATPNKLPVPYVVSSIRDFANLIEQLSEKSKFKIFGFEPTWANNTENRREKLGINLPVLKDTNIKISCDGPLVTFTFPKKYASKIVPGKYGTEDMQAIIRDIARYTGQKLGKRLENLSTIAKNIEFKKNKNGSTDIIVRIPANHQPVTPRKESQPPKPQKEKPVDILHPLTEEKPKKKPAPLSRDSIDRKISQLQEINEDDAASYGDFINDLNDSLRGIPGMDD